MADKRTVVTALARYGLNPVMRRLAGYVPGWALLETRGRRSGRLHRTPVGDGLRGNVFWIVAEHGLRADYVRNLIADPRVRVRVRGRWRTGRARVLPDDDARARSYRLGGINPIFVRIVGTDLLTVRVDLDPGPTVPRRIRAVARDGAIAGLVAGVVGGIPSTAHSIAAGRPVLRTVRAAGNVVAPASTPPPLLLALGTVSHLAISAGWGSVLALVLPRRAASFWGGLAGAGIAAVDLGVVGRLRPLVRKLEALPQVADHLVYGAVAGAIIERYRRDAATS